MSPRQRVLLIDDDHEVVHCASIRLKAAGYEAIEESNGPNGVAAAVKHHPDAIVLDVRMPKMDGLEALTELKREQTTMDIPVVMLSASIVDQQRALDAGARFFVKKPYEGSTLLAAIDHAIAETKPVENERAHLDDQAHDADC